VNWKVKALMRRSVVLWLMVSLTSCSNKPGAPPEVLAVPAPTSPAPDAGVLDDDPKAWQSYSADGKATLRQRSVGGDCYSECTLGDGTRVFEGIGPCFSAKHERHFVSLDCERVVIIIPAPDRGKAWSTTEVMRVYARNQLDYSVPGSAVIAEKFTKTSTSWLKGCFGVPGDEPRYSADGLSVEYETVEGKKGSVPLVAPPKKVDPPRPPAAPKRRRK
jgi:hypothetical protein